MTTQTLHLIDEYLMQGGYTHGIDAETLEREAHLVAAAPDLLAASEAFISELDSGDNFIAWEETKAKLRAAIAKAKGN
jgi:hypothetical protein